MIESLLTLKSKDPERWCSVGETVPIDIPLTPFETCGEVSTGTGNVSLFEFTVLTVKYHDVCPFDETPSKSTSSE
jgi:hypothetical protein